jgi:hypothetical protein
VSDRRFNRLRMPAESDPRPCPQFAGLEHRRATEAQAERAHRNTRRHHRDRRLAAKLDELLGPVDAEEGQ